MTRLQKKCYFAAAGFHLLLLVILLVGPAFLTSHEQADDLPVLDFIPLRATDLPFSNAGGTPNAEPPKPTPPAPEPLAAEPTPEPPKTIIEKIFKAAPPEDPQVKPEPVEPKPEPKQIETSSQRVTVKPQDVDDKKTSSKTKIEVSSTKVKRSAPTVKTHKPTPDTSAEDDARAERAAAVAAAKAQRDRVRLAANNISHGLSSSTSVTMPGPGGEAYANYAQIVKSKYTQEWNVPDDMADDSATAKVSVTIARDGTVVEAHVTRESGSAATDRSVREVLNRVKYIGVPFPAGSKDDQRTFIINFNLKAKKLLG
ncbi:MAG: TonB terminal [Verrucomicrobiota bacterium]|jgi:TonB family protein